MKFLIISAILALSCGTALAQDLILVKYLAMGANEVVANWVIAQRFGLDRVERLTKLGTIDTKSIIQDLAIVSSITIVNVQRVEIEPVSPFPNLVNKGDIDEALREIIMTAQFGQERPRIIVREDSARYIDMLLKDREFQRIVRSRGIDPLKITPQTLMQATMIQHLLIIAGHKDQSKEALYSLMTPSN